MENNERLEEERNLNKIEASLDRDTELYKYEIHDELDSIRDSWYTHDGDTYDLRRQNLKSTAEIRERIAEIIEIKKRPYFARMDLDILKNGKEQDDSETTFFIGEKGYSGRDSVHLIIDWRTEVGSLFYQKNSRQTNYNGYEYNLLLRRAIDIRNAKLVSVHTEYDHDDVTLEGDVIDPFLLDVLQDKRRQVRLTNIIRTIQSNQNDIMRLPANESFVVQGCAGSGKTMIMLHRLSILLFNNKNLRKGGIKIITPNKSFDEHIDVLSRELSLAEIQRFSVEEYYCNLMNRYRPLNRPIPVIYSEKTLKPDLMKELYSSEFADNMSGYYGIYWQEKLQKLSENGLDKLSKQYLNRVAKVNEYKETAYNELLGIIQDIENRFAENEKKLTEIQREYDNSKAVIREGEEEVRQYESELESERQILIALCQNMDFILTCAISKSRNKLHTLAESGKEYIRQREEQSAACDTARKQLSRVQALRSKYLDSDGANSFRTNDVLYPYVKSDMLPVLARIIDLQDEIQQAENDLHALSDSTGNFCRQLEKRIADMKEYYDACTVYDSMERLPDTNPVKHTLLNELKEIIGKIRAQQVNVASIPSYNFVRLNRENKNLTALKEQYREQAIAYINTMTQQYSAQVTGYHKEESELTSAIKNDQAELVVQKKEYSKVMADGIERYVQDQKKVIAEYEIRLSGLNRLVFEAHAAETEEECVVREAQELMELFNVVMRNARDMIPADSGLSDEQISMFNACSSLKTLSMYFTTTLKKTLESRRKYSKAMAEMPRLEASLAFLLNVRPEQQTVDKFNICKSLINDLSIDKVIANVESFLINDEYRRFGQKTNTRVYRHKVYLRLLTYFLYYRRLANTDSFLNIDEAQDISIAEYKLISSIAGENCVYNLYGDINQMVYSYKGIEDWDNDIPFITGEKIYYLNENYRNTVQITTYCNENFNGSMTAIGIDGEDVEEHSIIGAVAKITKYKEEHPDSRVAIIHRYGVKTIRSRLHSMLDGRNVVFDQIDDKNISVISVEMAKGLEFNAVLAIVDQMDDNEQYVAFTRALDVLYITRDRFIPGLEEEPGEAAGQADIPVTPDTAAVHEENKREIPAAEEVITPVSEESEKIAENVPQPEEEEQITDEKKDTVPEITPDPVQGITIINDQFLQEKLKSLQYDRRSIGICISGLRTCEMMAQQLDIVPGKVFTTVDDARRAINVIMHNDDFIAMDGRNKNRYTGALQMLKQVIDQMIK